MTDPAASSLRDLADKQAITEILYLYARGWDRRDEEAIRACFHPRATISFGDFEGSAEDFIAAGVATCVSVTAMSHLITNPMIVVKGDAAISECSFLAHHRRPAPDRGEEDMFLKGRFLDRFERKLDRWKIARREAYLDFERIAPPADRALAAALAQHRGRPSPDDPLYALLAGL